MPSSTLGAAPCSPSRSGGGGCSPPSPSHRSPDRTSRADALLRPRPQHEVIRRSRGVALAVELLRQTAHLLRMARPDEHALLRRNAVHRAAVRVEPKLVEVLRLRVLCLCFIDGHSIGLAHQQVDLREEAVAARMQRLSEHLAVQAALDAAAVDADLKTRGGHVALIVGGILLICLDGAVAAADGDLTAAEVRRRLRHLHRVFLPERLERFELMVALGSVLLAADDADGDAALGKDGRIGVGEFLFEVAAQLTEVRLGTLCCGLEALELLLAAADADGGAGLMQDGAVALMDLCAHLPVDGGIGCGYTAVPVCRRILLGAALKEPHLDLLAEVGEGVLEAAAVLIQRRLRPAAAGDGQRRAEVRDACAAVADGDVDVVAAIREAEKPCRCRRSP